MTVRVLTAEDSPAFQALWLRALQQHPEAYGASYDEEREVPAARIAKRLSEQDSLSFGAFKEDQLVGIARIARFPKLKTRHRAIVSGVYVVPEARGQRFGKALVQTIIDCVRGWEGLDDLILAVTVGNNNARALYIQAGFKPYSVDKRYLKINGAYHDMEWMRLSLHHLTNDQ